MPNDLLRDFSESPVTAVSPGGGRTNAFGQRSLGDNPNGRQNLLRG